MEVDNLSASNNPERLFFLGAFFFALIALFTYFFYRHSVVDFQFQDNYLVLTKFHIPSGIALFLMLQGVLYFFLGKWNVHLLPVLAKTYFVLVVVPLFLLSYSSLGIFPLQGISPQSLGQIAWASLAAILLAFFIFLCNISLFIIWQLIGVLGDRRRKNKRFSSRK